MNQAASAIPSYALYGDNLLPWAEDFFHCETIAARSQRHNWEIAPHRHPLLAQLLFVASGSVRVRLGAADRLLDGPVLVRVPCGTVHGFRFSPDVAGFVVTVSQDFIAGLARQDALRMQLSAPAIDAVSPQLCTDLLTLGRQLVAAEADRFDPDACRLQRALAEAWLRTASRSATGGLPARQTVAQRFQLLVETGYREHRPLEDYARRLNCTVRTLSRHTEEAFGMTPLQLINRRLIFEAQRLLRFTNASCREVATALGFEDPAYFSRFFRRMTGTSPSEGRAALSRPLRAPPPSGR